MNILKKPYEISVWEDVWNGEKFVEERLGVIGANDLEAPCRVFEPTLTRNVNGTKKLTFKIYKNYIDTVSGENIDNPFSEWLISERKVKLKLDNEWYDFIIKSISEESASHSVTYALEDACVQELSKNGFGLVLDDELLNNMGTARELAEHCLKETDWSVAEESEVSVQTIEESLVYLRTLKDIPAIQVIDQVVLTMGVSEKQATIPSGATILAFYSSCSSKPHRFQFIYVENLNEIEKDENRNILNQNCQYYFEVSNPEEYILAENGYGFYLPSNVGTTTTMEDGIDNVVVSGLYRGKRYGFSQESHYEPTLGRYVNSFLNRENGETYYGYQHTEYKSPALVQNLISNTQFKSTAGWIGTSKDSLGTKAMVETTYGYFNGGRFVSGLDELKQGVFPVEEKIYKPYLKVAFPDKNSWLINTGPYDNRTSIGNLEIGDEIAFNIVCYDSSGTPTTLTPQLGEYVYDGKNGYTLQTSQKVSFSTFNENKPGYSLNGNSLSTVLSNEYSENLFKKSSKVKLLLTPETTGTYYIEAVELFKASYCDKSLITLEEEEQASGLTNRTIENTYYYFKPDALKGIKEAEDLIPEEITKVLMYEKYSPLYVDGAQKIRSVEAKESNYFNILQSIAEKFELWLELKVTRNEDGAITKKEICFRNYAGDTNYAGFRYGVNLKDIKRTYESQKIVTKLIVKANSNEYADNGFCTIERAKANPTGENYIYDFQYFFNMGLLNARDFLDSAYVIDGAQGPDVQNGTEFNLKGYYPRIKAANNKLTELNAVLVNTAQDLLKYKADLEVATAGYEAALSGLEQSQEEYQQLTGVAIGGKIKEDLAKRSDVKKILSEYLVYKQQETSYSETKNILENNINKIQTIYDDLSQQTSDWTSYKATLNQLFFKNYSQFIQEGTWNSEDYVDDEKYYADALSIMYNSCYPQVAYTINVLELSMLPGYEYFTFNLGDTTFVEDPKFFGDEGRVEVAITEISENLDDPSKNSIKVQNFKNQFQDLFQKITATVQSVQYSTGSYQKAVALAEANQARKQQFLTDALDGANARLATAGQQSVTWGSDGLTIIDLDSPCNALKMIGGAILLSKQDENGEQKWTTGITSDGITASLITAGVINAGEISIMNYDEPLFRWDAHGITAYDSITYDSDIGSIISGIDSTKFVRHDKYGIYGINGNADGAAWHATSQSEIDNLSTFALTWEGLKVKNENGVTLRIGDGAKLAYGDSSLLSVKDSGGATIFSIKEDGSFIWSNESASSKALYSLTKIEKPTEVYNSYPDSGDGWHKVQSESDAYVSYSYDGGKTWSFPSQLFFSGEVSANVTYDSIWSAFNALATDSKGIFAFTDDAGNKLLGLNADLIKAGAIKVGLAEGTADEPQNYKFYADMATGSAAYLSGWEITSTAFKKGAVGEDESIILGTANFSGKVAGVDSTKWRMAIGSKFGVDSSGKLYASGADFSGSITATTGKIGKWWIEDYTNGGGLFGYSNGAAVTGVVNVETTAGYYQKQSLIKSGKSPLTFYSGSFDPGISANKDKIPEFSVLKDGSVYCSALKATGTIYATGGAIGADSVTGMLYCNNPITVGGSGSATAAVSEDGEVTSRATSGAESVTYFTKGLVGTNFLAAMGMGMADNAFYLGSGGLVFKNPNLYTYSESVTGVRYSGTRLTATGLILSGSNSSSSPISSHCSVGGNNITFFRRDNPSNDVLFGNTGDADGGHEGEEGEDDTPAGASSNQIAQFRTQYGTFNGNANQYFLQLSGNNQVVGTFITPNGTTYQANLAIENDAAATVSDRNRKNSIEDISEKFEAFFESLLPRQFKFNEGTSGRYHTGFIAQDVREALAKSNLSTTDFAGYVEYENGCGLRYPEFISLNTWQIQRLKKRLTEAEERIAKLEENLTKLQNSDII